MSDELETNVLRAVSRSFYLSLRFLSRPMRRPAGIAYLLARTSDTIADSCSLSVGERMGWLENFSRWMDGNVNKFPNDLVERIEDESERILVRRCGEVFAALAKLPERQRGLVIEVLETIVGGQRNDLEVFGEKEGGVIVSLPNAAALDDYTWKVAGCVGAFWTKLGYETLGKSFSKFPMEELLELGVEYGKGLQLVNILRDLPDDLKNGRCYLPVVDAKNEGQLMREFSISHEIAVKKVGAGFQYGEKLAMKRLRVASVLPAMIAKETLEMLEGVTFSRLNERVKVPRRRVYAMLFQAWMRF